MVGTFYLFFYDCWFKSQNFLNWKTTKHLPNTMDSEKFVLFWIKCLGVFTLLMAKLSSIFLIKPTNSTDLYHGGFLDF